MNMNKKTVYPFLLFFLLQINSKAQDTWFSFPGNAMQWINPALVSDTACHVRMTQRIQWPEAASIYSSLYAADWYLPGVNGWLTASFQHENYNKTYFHDRFAFAYIQQFRTGKNSSFRLAFEAAYFRYKLDWSKLTFGDMIDPRRGIVYSTNDIPRVEKIGKPDLSAGLVFSWKMIHTGLSVNHLTEPDVSLMTGSSSLPIRINLHAGADLYLSRDSLNTMVLQPYVLYMLQSTGEMIQAGLRFKYDRVDVHAGIGSLSSYFTTGAGLRIKNIRLNYNFSYFYNYQIGTAHEIGFNFRFRPRSPKKPAHYFHAGSFSS